jgi:hypothetical protein
LAHRGDREIATGISQARVHVLLRREGWSLGQNKTRRIYRELGLQLRSKMPKRRVLTIAGRCFFGKIGKDVIQQRACLCDPSPGTVERQALGVVRGYEPNSAGKRNLLTALIGLQRAADRRGNRGTRFRALVLQGAARGSECHRGLEGLFDPASTGNVEIEVVRLKHN